MLNSINFQGTLGDLLLKIEKLGFNNGWFFDIITLNDDMRITELNFRLSDFGAVNMTLNEFAQAFVNAYDVPGLNGVGQNKWQHRNLSQGWQVKVGAWPGVLGVVEVTPIITQTAFD